MTAACVVCTADTDANLCGRCTRQLEEAIGELPALLAELEVTITRQDRGTGTPLYAMSHRRLSLPGVHYDEGDSALPATAWPLSWDAANLAWTVRNTLGTWVRHLAESRGIWGGALADADVIAGPVHAWCMHSSCEQIRDSHRRDSRICAWLLRNIDAIRLDEAAGEIHEAILGDRREILQAIDRQAPDGYFGRCDQPDVRVVATLHAGPPCGEFVCGHPSCAAIREAVVTLVPYVSTCGAELLGRDGETEIRCRTCGAVYDTRTRKAALRQLLPDRVATVRVIADGLTKLDEPVTVDQITKWIERGQIPQRGADGKGHKLVRVGDVQAHLAVLKERLGRPRTRRKITAA